MGITVVRLAIGAAIVAGMLSGCGSGPSDAQTPAPAKTTTNATGSTEDPSTSTRSPATNTGSKAAVKAFVRRFVTVDNHATRTGDYSRRDTMVDNDTCDDCRESKAYARRIYKHGGKIEGGLFTHPKITVTGGAHGRYFANLDTVLSAYTSHDGDGSVIDRAPDQHEIVHYTVTKRDGQWTIVGGHTEMLGTP